MSSLTSPSEICENIIHHVKTSNLNYILSETPFSVNISLKKWFQKNNRIANFSKSNSEHMNMTEFKILRDANDDLKIKAEQAENESERLRETVAILTQKLYDETGAKCDLQEKLRKFDIHLDEKTEEIKVFKGVIRKHADEIAKQKSEVREITKVLKIKEKEIYNLENKAGNQLHTIQTLKDSNKTLKNDNKKLEKAKRQSENHAALKIKGLEKELADGKSSNIKDPVPKVATSTASVQVENECNLCCKVSSSEGNMKDHIESTHVDKNNNFECTKCMQLYPTKVELEAHTENDHQQFSSASKYDYSCTFCEKEFTAFAQLIDHMKSVHDLDSANQHLSTSKDWTEIYPAIADLIELCQSCTVAHEDGHFGFKVCEEHRGDFNDIFTELKEQYPDQIE